MLQGRSEVLAEAIWSLRALPEKCGPHNNASSKALKHRSTKPWNILHSQNGPAPCPVSAAVLLHAVSCILTMQLPLAMQDSYQPTRVCEGLWIVPDWCQPPEPAALNICMAPGLAFGTGTSLLHTLIAHAHITNFAVPCVLHSAVAAGTLHLVSCIQQLAVAARGHILLCLCVLQTAAAVNVHGTHAGDHAPQGEPPVIFVNPALPLAQESCCVTDGQ